MCKPKEECEHSVDLHSMRIATDCNIELVDDERLEFVIDIWCPECGTSGSFPVSVNLKDINW